MGLDVTAYKNIKLSNLLKDNFAYFDEKYICFNNEYFNRCDDILVEYAYTFDDCMDMSAGSYSTYNKWRDDLAKMAGYPLTEYVDGYSGHMNSSYVAACWNGNDDHGPFGELLNFSDCEGTLGTAVCKKLYQDFEEYKDVAKAFSDERRWWVKYDEWLELFKFASENGAIDFH